MNLFKSGCHWLKVETETVQKPSLKSSKSLSSAPISFFEHLTNAFKKKYIYIDTCYV